MSTSDSQSSAEVGVYPSHSDAQLVTSDDTNWSDLDRLLDDVTQTATLETGAGAVLDNLCAKYGWGYGEFWTVTGKEQVPTLCARSDEGSEELRRAAQRSVRS